MKMQKRRQSLQNNHNHFFKHFATKTYQLLGGVYDPPGKSQVAKGSLSDTATDPAPLR